MAGFSDDELSIEAKEGQLVVTGRKAETEEKATVLHRGIATRAFERRFQLADHVRAVEAVTENGLLHIDLVREVPEALKPRKIEISRAKAIESQAEAARSRTATGHEGPPHGGPFLFRIRRRRQVYGSMIVVGRSIGRSPPSRTSVSAAASRRTSSRSSRKIVQPATKSAAIRGPMTKPLIPKIESPPDRRDEDDVVGEPRVLADEDRAQDVVDEPDHRRPDEDEDDPRQTAPVMNR